MSFISSTLSFTKNITYLKKLNKKTNPRVKLELKKAMRKDMKWGQLKSSKSFETQQRGTSGVLQEDNELIGEFGGNNLDVLGIRRRKERVERNGK